MDPNNEQYFQDLQEQAQANEDNIQQGPNMQNIEQGDVFRAQQPQALQAQQQANTTRPSRAKYAKYTTR